MLSECVRCVGCAVWRTCVPRAAPPTPNHNKFTPTPTPAPAHNKCTTTHECAEGKLVCASRRASCGKRVGGWPSLRWRSHATRREREGGGVCSTSPSSEHKCSSNHDTRRPRVEWAHRWDDGHTCAEIRSSAHRPTRASCSWTAALALCPLAWPWRQRSQANNFLPNGVLHY
jgi:hypothetical protein